MDNNIQNSDPQQQQINIAQLLFDYEQRKAKGLIFWKKIDGTAVMHVKQFDHLQNEIESFKIGFTSTQIRKIENDFDRQTLDLKDQILDLESKIDALTKNKQAVVGVIKADVEATEASTDAPVEAENNTQ